jgi:hypothetical protein
MINAPISFFLIPDIPPEELKDCRSKLTEFPGGVARWYIVIIVAATESTPHRVLVFHVDS